MLKALKTSTLLNVQNIPVRGSKALFSSLKSGTIHCDFCICTLRLLKVMWVYLFGFVSELEWKTKSSDRKKQQ